MSRDRKATRRRGRDPLVFARGGEIAALALLLGAALASDSLILAGLVIAGAILALREAWRVVVSRRLGRTDGREYHFGFGKVLQAGNLLVAGAAVAAGVWLAGDALSRILTGGGEISPLGLALAATANAFAMAWNGIAAYAHPEPVTRSARALRRGRALIFASLAAVQVLLTVAVLAEDPAAASWIDTLGSILLSLLIVVGGFRSAWACICDLIDHPLDKDQEGAMVALLARTGLEPEELVDLRTRRCAERIFAELTLSVAESAPIEAILPRLVALRRTLEADVEDLDLTIKLQRAEP